MAIYLELISKVPLLGAVIDGAFSLCDPNLPLHFHYGCWSWDQWRPLRWIWARQLFTCPLSLTLKNSTRRVSAHINMIYCLSQWGLSLLSLWIHHHTLGRNISLPPSHSLLYGSELKDSFISVRSPHLRMKPAELAEQAVSWSYHYECQHLIQIMLLTYFSSICISWLCNIRLTEMRLGYIRSGYHCWFKKIWFQSTRSWFSSIHDLMQYWF